MPRVNRRFGGAVMPMIAEIYVLLAQDSAKTRGKGGGCRTLLLKVEETF